MNVAKSKGWETAVRCCIYHRNDTDQTRVLGRTRWYATEVKAESAATEYLRRKQMDQSCYTFSTEYAD